MKSCCCGSPGSLEPRRGFLTRLFAWLGGVFAVLPPFGAGLIAYLNPLRQKPTSGMPIRVGSLDSFSETPTKVTVRGDKVDAWSREADVPIGTIWVRKTAEGQIEAFQACCPHAGCTIGVRTIQDENGGDLQQYYCPCHMALFNLDGEQLPESTFSPRNMDSLDVDIRDGGEVWVTYQTFRTGSPQKIADA